MATFKTQSSLEFENDVNSGYVWKLKPGDNEIETLQSPEFSTGFSRQHKWQIFFTKTLDSKKIYLRLVQSSDHQVTVDIDIQHPFATRTQDLEVERDFEDCFLISFDKSSYKSLTFRAGDVIKLKEFGENLHLPYLFEIRLAIKVLNV